MISPLPLTTHPQNYLALYGSLLRLPVGLCATHHVGLATFCREIHFRPAELSMLLRKGTERLVLSQRSTAETHLLVYDAP